MSILKKTFESLNKNICLINFFKKKYATKALRHEETQKSYRHTRLIYKKPPDFYIKKRVSWALV